MLLNRDKYDIIASFLEWWSYESVRFLCLCGGVKGGMCRLWRGGLWWWLTCGVDGVRCGADLCGPILAAAGVRHIFHPRLILIQRNPGSFVVVRIVMVVVIRTGDLVDSDFAWFGGRPPPGSLCVRYFYLLFLLCGGGGLVEVVVVALDGWSLFLFWTRIWCRNDLRTGAI